MQAIIALVLPWWFGVLVTRFLFKENTLENLLIALGYGFFVGCSFIYLTCYISSLFSHFYFIQALCFLLIVNVVLQIASYSNKIVSLSILKKSLNNFFNCSERAIKLISIVSLTWLIFRLVSIGMEIVLQPLIPWDAYTSWLAKARFWFFSNQILEMTDYWNWIGKDQMAKGIYIHGSAGERSFLSYITLWGARSLGKWEEGLSLLPWLFAVAAYIFAYTGQLLKQGVPLLIIIISILVLLSMPIFDSHIALPGYADLWVSIFIGLGIISLYTWCKKKCYTHLGLCIMAILNCYLVKSQSGAVWAFLLFLALITSFLKVSAKKLMLSLVFGCLMFFIAVLLGIDIGDPAGIQLIINKQHLKIPFLFNSNLPNINEVISRLYVIKDHLFLYGNWGMFWYLYLISFIIFFKSIFSNIPTPIIFFIISGFFIILFYVLMINYISVSVETVINRAFLHVLPSLIFLVVVLYSVNNKLTDNIKS